MLFQLILNNECSQYFKDSLWDSFFQPCKWTQWQIHWSQRICDFWFFHPLLRAAYQQLVRDKKIRLPRFSFAFWRFSKQPWDFFSHWGHFHLTNPTRTLMKCFVKPLSLTLDFICFLLLKDRVVGAGGILAPLFVDTNERSPIGHLIREIWRMRVGTTKLILLSL